MEALFWKLLLEHRLLIGVLAAVCSLLACNLRYELDYFLFAGCQYVLLLELKNHLGLS